MTIIYDGNFVLEVFLTNLEVNERVYRVRIKNINIRLKGVQYEINR